MTARSLGTGFVLLLAFSLRGHAASAATPNILFVMIDDLGWMDLGCQGNKLVETPHIDRLAQQGMRFTDAYAAAPVCSPSRAAILTGQSPARLHITNHTPDRDSFTPDGAVLQPAEMLDRLSREYVTVAEHLKKVGYRTGFFRQMAFIRSGQRRRCLWPVGSRVRR